MNNCIVCKTPIHPERAEIIPTCVNCTDQTTPIAFNVFGHKTAPEIALVKGKENIRQAINADRRKR